MKPFFLDNTDPDGIDRVFDAIGDGLTKTLTVVISKSGGTKETRNGMLEAKAQYERLGLAFGRHAVAVTGEGSDLDKYAVAEGFLARFPMWDWVGGRTSELSAVGLLPAALQGIDIREMLSGASRMDAATRVRETRHNPAALLALAWYSATGGHGKKDMVVLPYKDRLELFSRYLQQLVMESLGKRLDLDGKEVHQGIAVYGNKGSTDQHAYVQQLRDGLDNFFITFLEVLKDRAPERAGFEVEKGVTAGDYLSGFLQGTRTALTASGRESLTITIETVDAAAIGMLIALYERAVGFYAVLVNVNAYHQPGVEAGKKAAQAVIDLQHKVLAVLDASKEPLKLEAIAAKAGTTDLETVFCILRHLTANPERGVRKVFVGPGAGVDTASLFDLEYARG
jgi:glucose-6-phosphate isomerase